MVTKEKRLYRNFRFDDLKKENSLFSENPIYSSIFVCKIIQQEAKRLYREYAKTLGGGTGIRGPKEPKKSFYMPGNYSMPTGAHTFEYDYAFLSQYSCCRVGGGFFENGVGVEPFTKYVNCVRKSKFWKKNQNFEKK